MSKFLGVAALWVCLIALPHLTAPVSDAPLIGASSTLAMLGDDPGDPFLFGAMPASSPPPGATAQATPKPREHARTFASVHFKNELGKAYTVVEVRLSL